MGQSHSSTTDVKVHTHRWTINNFLYCRAVLVESAIFNGDGFKWRMELRPNSLAEPDNDWVSLFLRLVESNRGAVQVLYKLVVYKWKRGDDEAFQRRHTMLMREEERRFVPGQSWGFEQFLRRQDLVGLHYLDGNKDLKICCALVIVDCTVPTLPPGDASANPNQVVVTVPERCLSTDVAQLFDNDQFADCTLVAGDKEFKAHKSLLSVRSPVFCAMFKHQMQEAQTDRVPIADLEPDVVHQMLQFMYTGEAPEVESMASKLLVAADKYQLQRLRAICERALSTSLTAENVCETLIMADRHSTEQLKMCAIVFIKTQPEVTKTEGWATLVKEYPQLITDIMMHRT